jgi:hypothetical protein
MRSLDTSPEAARAQILAYRRMGPARRALMGLQMSDDARRLSEAGIRARHPSYSQGEVRHALNRLVLGDDLFQAAWPEAPLLAP